MSGEGDVYGAEEESAPLAMIFNPWPDFRDPATLGVLVAQVRERSGDPHLFAEWAEWGVGDEGLTEGEWWCARLDEEGVAGPTEQAAWVAALEACAEA